MAQGESDPHHRAGQDLPADHNGFPRRSFLGGAGALLAAGLAGAGGLSGLPRASAAPAGGLRRRPNIVVIVTDQERAPMYWPEGWGERNLPNRARIAAHGLTFANAFCNSTMCSPSRSTLFTGLYPAQHGVTSTLTNGGTMSPLEPQLRVDEQNMARLLASAGYNVHYRGKWHMSKGADGWDPTTEDIAAYGFQGWQPPEAAQDVKPEHFGGGCANIDEKYAGEAVSFLRSVSDEKAPFALIVSYGNPHDILAYPKTWNQQDGDCDNYGSDAPACFNQGIELPPTFGEVLATNFKPTAQVQSHALLAGGLGPLVGREMARNYVNFYAFVQKVVDKHIGAVMDAIESRPGMLENTVIVRVADHGEMGLSHGGLRQKIFNVYEETMRVPIVVSNPTLFPKPVTTNALATLIDLMPTLASIAGVPDRNAFRFLGTDLMPVVEDAAAHPGAPRTRVQDTIQFTFDDQNVATPDGQNVVRQPSHIRCVRGARFKYGMYFDPEGVIPPQFELYDLQSDPMEMHNMADPRNVRYFAPDQLAVMQAKLMEVMARTGTTPKIPSPRVAVT